MDKSFRQSLFLPIPAPRLSDLALMMHSRRIVLADHLVWSRKSRVHRFQMRDAQGATWIHLPLCPEDKKRSLREIRSHIDSPSSDNTAEWIDSWMETFRTAYSGSRYFEEYELPLKRFFEQDHGPRFLTLVNAFRHLLFTWLHVDDLIEKEVHASSFPEDEWVRMMTQEEWVVEPDSSTFLRSPNSVLHPSVSIPPYGQHFQPFIPDCCILDLLFEQGPESWKVLQHIRIE